ncbi:VOC family protein [Marinilactibacillus sp. GCM10026970]|uniref:VOC family protein n=1 Tax=Marinilactibacillus sp. GCM10026970 TaxID=3252642 RepID=UPI00360D07CC
MEVKLSPYLLLNGNTKEAISFYTDAFGGSVESMELVKDWPHEFENGIPEGYEENVMHSLINIGGSWLMLADTLPDQNFHPGSAISIMIDLKEIADAEKLYDKLSMGAEIDYPLGKTSYSPAYAQLTDKFGINWQIITEFKDKHTMDH